MNAWEKLRHRAVIIIEREGLTAREVVLAWGLNHRQEVERYLKPGGTEPRYSLGKKIEAWVERKSK